MHQTIVDVVAGWGHEPVAVLEVLGGFLIPLIMLAFVAVLAIWSYRRRKAMVAAHQQACLDHRLTATDTPLGIPDGELVRFGLLPRGDRRYGAAWGMQGPAELQLNGTRVTVECAAFQWWWEERHTDRDSNGTTTTRYVRRERVAGLVRLSPPYVMPAVRVTREGLLTRMGVGGRGDFQVESEEFNRRHDVRVDDRETAIHLFDADFQQRMLGPLRDATFELTGDLALVTTGAPSGVALVRALPEMRHKALGLLEAMPQSWWRAVSRRTA